MAWKKSAMEIMRQDKGGRYYASWSLKIIAHFICICYNDLRKIKYLQGGVKFPTGGKVRKPFGTIR